MNNERHIVTINAGRRTIGIATADGNDGKPVVVLRTQGDTILGADQLRALFRALEGLVADLDWRATSATSTARAASQVVTAEVDPITEAEKHVRNGRAAATTEDRTKHAREGRAWLERARHELAGLRREAGASPRAELLEELGAIARRIYVAEQTFAAIERRDETPRVPGIPRGRFAP